MLIYMYVFQMDKLNFYTVYTLQEGKVEQCMFDYNVVQFDFKRHSSSSSLKQMPRSPPFYSIYSMYSLRFIMMLYNGQLERLL